MKITVINGTELRGITHRMKEIFLDGLRENAEISEFYLPADGPGFCRGCKVCFLHDEKKCKDAERVGAIERAMLDADLLVFTSPAYVFHTTGAMKALLDHFGYRWMPHRPAKEMFGKRAVIITQCLGAGGKGAAKDIRDSLAWWGVSSVKVCSFHLMSDVVWERIPEKRRAGFEGKLKALASKMRRIDYAKPARTRFPVKMKFYVVRMMQTGLGKQDPDYTDFRYWKEQGWIGKVRPWK